MKRLLFILAIFLAQISFSQQTYSVNGENLSLYSEAEGSLTLLWNSFDGNYRYFLKKDNEIVELKNTKVNGDYQEEYKDVLKNYTGADVSKVNLTKADLSKTIDAYNVANDSSYVSEAKSVQLKTRLGAFAGITNYAYFLNPENTSLPQLGAELEIIDEVKLKRHSLAVQLRHIIGNDDFDFSSTQVSLNYRFKFVKCETFDVYVNTKIADYVHISQDINVAPDIKIGASGGEFQAPFALGVGADIALGNGFLTILYQDIVALNLNDNGEFPIDFAVGYKWNL
jgi:hypothetical protein